MTARDDIAYPDSVSPDSRVFVGYLHFREVDGAATWTTFRLEVGTGRVSLTYGDNVEHVTNNPATVEFFTDGLIPSLEAVGAAVP